MNSDNISAFTFIELWKNFWSERLVNEGFVVSHLQSIARTKLIIGEKMTERNNGSPLGNYIISYYENLDYIKEDCLFDLSVYYEDEFKNILNYDEDNKATEINTQSNTCNAILVEQENEILLSNEEMIKLTYVKAKLKVIIVFDRWNDIEFAKRRLGSNLRQIIYQANSKLIEPLETEYLLIIGDANKADINWDDNRFVFYSVEQVMNHHKVN